MFPVIYVSPAFRTACAEPRGALLLLHSDPVRSAPIVGSAASGARLLHPVRAERLVSCTHAHGLRLGFRNRHCAVLLPSGFVKISSNQLFF